MKKRILSMLLTLCMIVSLVSSVAYAATVEDFTDVSKGDTFYEWIADVTAAGYFKGTTETTFSPQKSLTRGQFVTVLYRMSGDTFTADAEVFPDVAEGRFCYDSVAWAAANGIVYGYYNGTFGPNDSITRQQMSAMVIRFLNYMAEKCGVTYDHLQSDVVAFLDADSVSNAFKTTVELCQRYGIISGYPVDGGYEFRPLRTFTRAQGSKVVSILADILENGKSAGLGSGSGSGSGSGGVTPGATTYTYTLDYHVTTDGSTWSLWQGKSTTANSTTNAAKDLTITSEVPENYIVGGVEYTFAGWGRSLNNGTNTEQLQAGDVVSVSANDSVTLYAVYVALDDYVYWAMEDAVADMQSLAATLNGMNANVGNHNVSADDFSASVEVGNLTYGTSAHSVDVAVTGELKADIIERVLEIATTYAVAILGTEPIPTVDEITDLVKDAAADLGLTITEMNARAIAEDVYEKLQAKGADVWSNFRNYNGGYCVDEINVENGKVVLAVNNTNGVEGSGSREQDLKDAGSLVVAVAKELYASLNSQAASSTSDVALESVVSVVFNRVDGASYHANYDINLTVNLSSDMFSYSWDGTMGTLTMTVTTAIQDQYAESVSELIDASLNNETISEKLTAMVQDKLANSDMISKLADMSDADVNGAIETWVDANLDKIVNGETLDNTALYTLVDEMLADVAAEVAMTALDEADDYSASENVGGVVITLTWNDLSAEAKFGFLKAAITQVLASEDYQDYSDEIKDHLTNLILIDIAAEIGYTLPDADSDGVNNYVEALEVTSIAVYAYVDQMITDAIDATTIAGKPLNECLDLMEKAKTVKGMQNVVLSNVGTILEDSTFQALAANHGNAYVDYIATAIAKLPASASVTINGVALNQAALETVKTAAEGNDIKAVCDALADLFKDTALSGLSMNSFADGEVITVAYGARTFAFNFVLVIE